MLKNDKANHSKYFGHYGFKRPQCTVSANSTLNVKELEEQLERFVSLGFATKNGDVYDVNLTEAGIDKLLGNGNIVSKVNVTVSEASESAVEKIKAAGGSIVGFDEEEAAEESEDNETWQKRREAYCIRLSRYPTGCLQ